MNKTELLQKTLYLLDRVDVPPEFSNLAELIEVELAKPDPVPFGYVNHNVLNQESLTLWKTPGANGTNYPLYTKDKL